MAVFSRDVAAGCAFTALMLASCGHAQHPSGPASDDTAEASASPTADAPGPDLHGRPLVTLYAAVGVTGPSTPESELMHFDVVIEVVNDEPEPVRGLDEVLFSLMLNDGTTLATGHDIVVELYEPGDADPHDWVPFIERGTPFTGVLPRGRSWVRARGGLDHPPPEVAPMQFGLSFWGGGAVFGVGGEILPGPS